MNDRAWIATRKGLFELRSRARTWRVERVHFLGEPVSMLLPPSPDAPALAALQLGHFGAKVQASADAGDHWQEVATPAYPAQPADAAGPPWTLVQIWSLEAAGGAIWAGTLPGGLFRSDDRGASWQLERPLWDRPERAEWFGGGYDVPGIHSICPHPQRPDELLIAVSCGGVWQRSAAGPDWAPRCRGLRATYMPPERAEDPAIQDPHAIARCRAAPDVLWCQHHNGMWRTEDGAGQWHELVDVPLSNFGFAVAAHPSDPLVAWFVPAVADQQRVPVRAALAVTRTRDGGRRFETLRDGLPQAECYDLVYRHGLAVDDSGERLLMGSTTGGLWSSFDQGDSWQPVAARLPPIYAVRFG